MDHTGKKKIARTLQLIRELVISEFKLRYQNSWLGYFWTLIKPLLLFGVIYLVFSLFMPSPIPNYQVYLMLGIIIWNYFAESTLMGMSTFANKREMVTKIAFSRASLVIASTLSSTVTLVLNLIIFFVFLIVSGVVPGVEALFFILYLLEVYLIATGITFILATLHTFFRDIQHIWEILLQIGFWLTPIIYSVNVVPEQYHRYIFLNPLARIIEYSRDIFIRHNIPAIHLNVVLLIMSMVIFGLGYVIFRSQSHKIAEKI